MDGMRPNKQYTHDCFDGISECSIETALDENDGLNLVLPYGSARARASHELTGHREFDRVLRGEVAKTVLDGVRGTYCIAQDCDSLNETCSVASPRRPARGTIARKLVMKVAVAPLIVAEQREEG